MINWLDRRLDTETDRPTHITAMADLLNNKLYAQEYMPTAYFNGDLVNTA